MIHSTSLTVACSDENRGYLLEAGFPQIVLNILEGYAELIPSAPPLTPLTLSIPHLKVIRTAIGVLLNAIIGYGTSAQHNQIQYYF